MKTNHIRMAYEMAHDQYAELGIDTEQVLREMQDFHLSLPCPQGNDADALRRDILTMMASIAGSHRLRLSASALGNVDDWIGWGREHRIKLDLDFADAAPSTDDGLGLAHPNNAMRDRWIAEAKRCREQANAIGEAQHEACIVNFRVNDGSTGRPTVERSLYRELLEESLDEIFATPYRWVRDSIGPLVHGTCQNEMTVGADDFCFGYAVGHGLIGTLDTGHYGHSATAADKLTAMLRHVSALLLHLGSPAHYAEGQTVRMDDATLELFHEVVRGGLMNHVHYTLGALPATCRSMEECVTAARVAQRCMMRALLEPINALHNYELSGQRQELLALLEQQKSLPWAAVYEEYCLRITPSRRIP